MYQYSEIICGNLCLCGISSEKIKRLDVVNPDGYSRRTAWNMLGRLIKALANRQAVAVDDCLRTLILCQIEAK